MKIELNVDKVTIDTNTMPGVEAFLIEKCEELIALHTKYKKGCFISSDCGPGFYFVAKDTNIGNVEESLGIVKGCIREFNSNQFKSKRKKKE